MALSYGLSLNVALMSSINSQCTLANSIVSVERHDQYMHISSEAPEVIEDNRTPINWPAEGKVEIQNLKVIFLTQLHYILSLKLLCTETISMRNRLSTDLMHHSFYTVLVAHLREVTRLASLVEREVERPLLSVPYFV